MAKEKETVDRRTLALWIERGGMEEGVEEDCDHMLKPIVLASTLGLALIGKCGSKEEALRLWTEYQPGKMKKRQPYTRKVADLLGIPLKVVEKISRLTYQSTPANEIRKMLTEGDISF